MRRVFDLYGHYFNGYGKLDMLPYLAAFGHADKEDFANGRDIDYLDIYLAWSKAISEQVDKRSAGRRSDIRFYGKNNV